MVHANNFSVIDLVIIRQQLSRQPDEVIAEMIGKPVELVRSKINELTGGGSIRKSKSQDIELKQIEKESRTEKRESEKQARVIKKAKDKTEKKLRTLNGDIANAEYKKASPSGRLPKVKETVFETRKVVYSETTLVRIDSKTCICIKRGEDPVKAKEQYLKRIEEAKKASLTEEDHQPKKVKTKMCNRCEQRKKIEQFGKNSNSEDGHADRCNKCVKIVAAIKAEEKKY